MRMTVWTISRDTPTGREFSRGNGWPHLPEAWTSDPKMAHVYFERAHADNAREWISANTSGASIEVSATQRDI